MKYFWIGIFICIGLYACDSSNLIVEKELEDSCWSISDTLSFEYTVHSSTKGPSIQLQFFPDYPFRNIYLQLLYTSSLGGENSLIVNDTLLDAEGNWVVEQKGGKFTVDIHPFEKQTPLEDGTYQFKLIHQMRSDNLCEIDRLGVL